MHSRRLAAPAVVRLCPDAGAAHAAELCRPAALVIGLDRPDGLQGALEDIGASARLVSVTPRHLLRMTVERYAGTVLLSRLQAEGLERHVFAGD